MASLKVDNQRKRHILDTQEFSPTDVQRIRQERQQLERHLEQQERENQGRDKQIWQDEMEIGKGHSEVIPEYSSPSVTATPLP